MTKWKIRNPYYDEIEKGYLDAKTKIIINGLIDNSSFTKNNKFSYDCYMEVKNFVYNGEDYIEYYEDDDFKEEIRLIIDSLSSLFNE